MMYPSRTTTATAARIRSVGANEWSKDSSTANAKDLTKVILKKTAGKQTPVKASTVVDNGDHCNNEFYQKTTLWEQELHRYKPSTWLAVRVGTLIAYPYLMSSLGELLWPQVHMMTDRLGWEIATIAQPAMALISVVAFVVLNILYTMLYYYDIPALRQYRVDDKPWHWELLDSEGWKKMLHNTIWLVLFNFFCVSPAFMYLINICIGNPLRQDIESLPTGGEIFWQIMLCLVLEDFGFHHAHQLLHTKQFYWIHKVHHQYHAPIGIASVYAHPIEYVFGNMMPSLLGPGVLQYRMHSWTFCVWLIFRSSAAVENHSGYEFPWSMFQAIPFKAPTEYHDFHHNKNLGTYSGVLRFWDWVYGTNSQYFEWVRAGRPQRTKRTNSSRIKAKES